VRRAGRRRGAERVRRGGCCAEARAVVAAPRLSAPTVAASARQNRVVLAGNRRRVYRVFAGGSWRVPPRRRRATLAQRAPPTLRHQAWLRRASPHRGRVLYRARRGASAAISQQRDRVCPETRAGGARPSWLRRAVERSNQAFDRAVADTTYPSSFVQTHLRVVRRLRRSTIRTPLIRGQAACVSSQPPAQNSTDRGCVSVTISSAFGNRQRDVVVLFMSAEPPDFIDDG